MKNIKKVLVVLPLGTSRLIKEHADKKEYEISALLPFDKSVIKLNKALFEYISDSNLDKGYKEVLYIDPKNPDFFEIIKSKQFDAIIPGAEQSVELSELICKKLGFRNSNDFDTSQLRRNKFFQQQALKKNNLNYIECFKSNDLSKILHWWDSKKNFPCVLKYTNGAGAYGFHYCKTKEQIINAFNKMQNERSISTNTNDILIEKYIDAPIHNREYVINCVSCNGKHIVTDVHQYLQKEIGGYVRYYVCISVDDHKLINKLASYTIRALNALEIKYGISHAEVFLDEKGDPVLCECAARAMGGPTYFEEKALKLNPLVLNLHSFCKPNKFKTFAKYDIRKIKPNKHICLYFFGVHKKIQIHDYLDFSEILKRKHSSFIYCKKLHKINDIIAPDDPFPDNYYLSVHFADKNRLNIIDDIKLFDELSKKENLFLKYKEIK